MSLKPANLERYSQRCSICGKGLFRVRGGYAKCPECADKIAKQIERDFQDNIGHHMTEAILATGNEELLIVSTADPFGEQQKLMGMFTMTNGHWKTIEQMEFEDSLRDLIETFSKVDVDGYKNS